LVPPLSRLVDVPLVSGAEGIHGPLSLPAESDFDDDAELSELDGGAPVETPDGMAEFREELCADAGVGEQQIISAAIRANSTVAWKGFSGLWNVGFIGSVFLYG
jgi:hypothetical protein